jgi:hypothetical protein
LNYELDTDHIEGFSDFETKLVTERVTQLSKTRYFKGLMWFAYANNFANWHVRIEKIKRDYCENKLKTKFLAGRFQLKSYKKERRILITLWARKVLARFTNLKRKKPSKKPRPVGENVIIANNKKASK